MAPTVIETWEEWRRNKAREGIRVKEKSINGKKGARHHNSLYLDKPTLSTSNGKQQTVRHWQQFQWRFKYLSCKRRSPWKKAVHFLVHAFISVDLIPWTSKCIRQFIHKSMNFFYPKATCMVVAIHILSPALCVGAIINSSLPSIIQNTDDIFHTWTCDAHTFTWWHSKLSELKSHAIFMTSHKERRTEKKNENVVNENENKWWKPKDNKKKLVHSFQDQNNLWKLH